MDLSLQNKHALVCGSTQGIGKAIAIELALLGATVTLIARNEEKLKQTLPELDHTNGQEHAFLVADFSDPESLEEKISTYLAGKPNVHILINNTGGPAGGPILDATPDQFRDTFTNHLICNHILAQATVPFMKKAGYGRIINIISTSVKQPLKGLGVSNTIRAAVGNWAKTLSMEVAPFGITVNNVLPGATLTGRLSSIIATKAGKSGSSTEEISGEMLAEIPAGRFGKPEEVAAAAAFLASPAAAYINSINIPVDGGRTGDL